MADHEEGVDSLQTSLSDLRIHLEKGFSAATALPGSRGEGPSAGHCAAAAAIVQSCLGGELMSTVVRGESHWFNRITVGAESFDVDLTGDQFGRRPIEIAPAGSLYESARIRSRSELNDETVARSVVLAEQAGLSKVAESLREERELRAE